MSDKKLLRLYHQVDKCKFCKAKRNKLQHIHGFGAMRPRLMLILINPTYRNLSSVPNYKGPRFPFIGVRQFWRVLADGGLINKKIAYSLPLRADWQDKHTKQVQKELLKNKLFLTNIVKCCYNHSFYPDNRVIAHQRQHLKEEIRSVKPKRIVAFSGLVYKNLTGRQIKLADVLKKEVSAKENISGLGVSVKPCYFPVGRGNPKKAAIVLRKLLRQYK